MHKYLRARHIGAAGIALWSLNAMGIEPIDVLLYDVGPLIIKPQLTVAEVFNDNIFYRNEEKISDFITFLSPGLDFQIGDKEYNYVTLDYTYDRLIYADNPDQDANQHRITLTDYFQHSRLTLSGQDDIQFLATPLGGGISFRAGKVERRTYLDKYRLTYDLSDKTAPYIEALHSTTDFQDGISLYDSTTLRGTLGFEYKAFSRTSFFGEFYYGQTSNDPNTTLPKYPTATMYGAFLGARGNFTEKLSGSVKAGYEFRTYSDDSPDSGLPVVELDLLHQFSERTSLGLTYTHRQYESVQFTRSAYTTDAVSLGLKQEIGNEDRFRATLRATYSKSSFEPNPAYLTDREDNLLLAQLALSYDFKLWLRGFVGYDFEHLDSSTPVVLDYDDNRVTIGVSVGY